MSKNETGIEVTVRRLQFGLRILREFRGWDSSRIYSIIDVHPMTYSRLEREVTKLNVSQYATIRFALQASIIELSEDDARWFSYILETFLDPSVDASFANDLLDGVAAAVAAASRGNTSRAHNVIEAVVNGTADAVAHHHIKYTTDLDGLDWYYDLVGLPRPSDKIESLGQC